MIPGQMDIYECIAIAMAERRGMNVDTENARRIAHVVTDDAVEAVEAALGVQLTDEQWEQVSDALETDVAEAIVENFAELG